jgi:5-enolpyruvylshikimate-3-phosphate synthase
MGANISVTNDSCTTAQSNQSNYIDHRMAMAFAPAIKSISSKKTEVVSKSYPDFGKTWS